MTRNDAWTAFDAAAATAGKARIVDQFAAELRDGGGLRVTLILPAGPP